MDNVSLILYLVKLYTIHTIPMYLFIMFIMTSFVYMKAVFKVHYVRSDCRKCRINYNAIKVNMKINGIMGPNGNNAAIFNILIRCNCMVVDSTLSVL